MLVTELTAVLHPSYPSIAPPKICDPYLQFMHHTAPFRDALLNHPIHSKVVDLAALRLFMESHVFVLWGEMVMLNALQQRLMNSKVSWLAITDSDSIQLVHDIALVEGGDTPEFSGNDRQFQLCRAAMAEIGADGSPFQVFLEAVQQGMCPNRAVSGVSIPGVTKTAAAIALSIASLTNHEVVAALIFRQKDVTSTMFRKLLRQLEANRWLNYPNLQLYLQGYVHSDVKVHAPLKQILLQRLCSDDPLKWEQAQDAARLALKIKRSVWDYLAKNLPETS